jgi:ABC-2 type transport system ATP-binding protein
MRGRDGGRRPWSGEPDDGGSALHPCSIPGLRSVSPAFSTVAGVDATDSPALALRGLTKQYDQKLAVAGIDLDVPVGSFYGLLGPNGAGKTTSLSMAVGLLRPTQGRAFVLGLDVWADPVRAKQRLGVLPDAVRMFDRLSGAELLAYNGLLRGMPPDVVDQRGKELLDVLGLADAGRTLVVDYSAGMKKKIGLACALLHAPRLLVLDEPFEAVDPVSGALIRDILHRFVSGGGTVIFSSHVLELVERLCTHVAILAEGRLKAVGTLDEVRHGRDLEDVFVEVVGGRVATGQELSWL